MLLRKFAIFYAGLQDLQDDHFPMSKYFVFTKENVHDIDLDKRFVMSPGSLKPVWIQLRENSSTILNLEGAYTSFKVMLSQTRLNVATAPENWHNWQNT
jgi:hypothetical protein